MVTKILIEIGILWVLYALYMALSDWWLISGTEDLDETWHSVHVKQWKMLQLIPIAIPLSAMIGGIYWLFGHLL